MLDIEIFSDILAILDLKRREYATREIETFYRRQLQLAST